MPTHESRSAQALDALPDPVLVVDEDERVVLGNRRAMQLLVAEPEDSEGRRHAVETNNLFFSAFRARSILQGERSAAERELLLVDPVDGSDLLFEVIELPFANTEADTDARMYLMREITDLRLAAHELEIQISRSLKAEYEARRESERLNVIIENAGVPIVVTDHETNIVLINPEAERLLHVGTRSSPVSTNDAKLAGFLNEFLLQPSRRREARLSLVSPSTGIEFPVQLVSSKILDERDEPIAVVAVLHDLTQEVENQRLTRELRRLNAELESRVIAATRELEMRNVELEERRAEVERASRMKSEFLATMSHELRTPIHAMISYNSLLREGLFGATTGEQDRALDRAKKAAEHLLALINDILDLSRVEAGKLRLSADEIDLRDFLDRLSDTVRLMTDEKSLGYSLQVDDALPSIVTDETRLRQVLLNLLSNAVKFTDAGSVTLKVDSDPEEGWLRLAVIDTGIGIADEHLDAIFEEFTQEDQSPTRSRGGAGLGLAISRKLVEAMGGALEVESVAGRGSTFSIDIPWVLPGHASSGRSGVAQSEEGEADERAPAVVPEGRARI
jgi:signal transduction histidine kinase